MTGMKMAPSRSETMAEMQSSPPAAFSPSLSSPSSARARPAPVLLPSPASKLIQSCSMPRRPLSRPPRSLPCYAWRGRSWLAGARTELNLPVRATRSPRSLQRRRRSSTHRRRRCYLPQRSRRPSSLPLSLLPSTICLSLVSPR